MKRVFEESSGPFCDLGGDCHSGWQDRLCSESGSEEIEGKQEITVQFEPET